MKLEEIKKEIEELGYKFVIRDLYEYGKCLQGGIPDEETNYRMDSYFRILIIENKLMLDSISQIKKNKFFDSKKEIIDYIKGEYPIV